jgi:hypothetical protein
VITYRFGTGRGPVHHHRSPPDLTLTGAVPDAVALDFDGDGRVDDALWDTDGDGTADRAVLDLDDDGRPERVFADPSGRGVWDAAVTGTVAFADVRGRVGTAAVTVDTDGDGRPDGGWAEVDHDPATRELVCDLDGDGRADQLLVDHDGDGRAEAAYGASGPGGRWDVLLADTDADGTADVEIAEDASGWVPP